MSSAPRPKCINASQAILWRQRWRDHQNSSGCGAPVRASLSNSLTCAERSLVLGARMGRARSAAGAAPQDPWPCRRRVRRCPGRSRSKAGDRRHFFSMSKNKDMGFQRQPCRESVEVVRDGIGALGLLLARGAYTGRAGAPLTERRSFRLGDRHGAIQLVAASRRLLTSTMAGCRQIRTSLEKGGPTN